MNKVAVRLDMYIGIGPLDYQTDSSNSDIGLVAFLFQAPAMRQRLLFLRVKLCIFNTDITGRSIAFVVILNILQLIN